MAFKIEVIIRFSDLVHVLSALIDSGAMGNFIDTETTQRLQVPMGKLLQPLNIQPIGEGLITSKHTAPHSTGQSLAQ